jgi:hypothetical protein
MITIFRGRKLSLQGAEEVIYAEVAVALRDQIHHFNTGKSCNPFAVFMKVALHTDEHGWAFPRNGSISASTGISTAHALAAARAHLQNVRIDGHRVLEVYRERRPDGTFGRHLYRIFPDAWTDGLDNVPATFDAEALALLVTDEGGDSRDKQPDVDNPQHKKNHLSKDHQDPRSGSAGIDSTATGETLGESHVEGQLPVEEGGTKTEGAFEPCDLAQFIETHSKYRFKQGGQHQRLLRIVPDRDRQHPAPNDLYLDKTQGEAFKAWVLTKIEWAEGETRRRKPLKSLVSAICNYAQPQFGWFAFSNAWLEVERGARDEPRRETPGDSGRTEAFGGSPPGQESGAGQRHRAQVASFLANAARPPS